MARSSEFSKKIKLEAFKRCGGKCEGCTANLKVGEGEYDHRIPLAMGGTSNLSNCQVLCLPCHRGEKGKTKQDVKEIAKAKRREAKHLGVTKPEGKLKSKGFEKVEKSTKRAELPELPRRALYTSGK